MKEFEQLSQIITNAQGDVLKFDAGNKAAGTRVRKAMQDLKEAAQTVRQAVLAKAGGDKGEA